jgi:pyruvate kinase
VSSAVSEVTGLLRRMMRTLSAGSTPGRQGHGALRGMDEQPGIDADLSRIEAAMTKLEEHWALEIQLVHECHRADAVNLAHYVAVRQSDVRALQRTLGELGLSSLGRCEPHVLATVESVRRAAGCAPGRKVPPSLSFRAGRAALDRNTDELFGPRPHRRVPRVMVTLPTEAATDYGLVRRLVSSGMDIARINGAHDDAAAWELMARNVRKAAKETERTCRICMDAPGPKLRTGPLIQGPRVLRLRPTRDLRGVATVPARAVLVDAPPVIDRVPAIPVDPAWIARRAAGDVLELLDTRGSHRQLDVVEGPAGTLAVEAWDTTYLEAGMEITCRGDVTRIGLLEPVPQYHVLGVGDRLRLTRAAGPAPPWRPGQDGTAWIGCTLGAAFEVVRPGQAVVLDDGRISGTVEAVTPSEILVQVLTAAPGGSKLRAEKGINFPGCDLPVPAVGPDDVALLRVAAHHADMVAMSFVRSEEDVDAMRTSIGELDAAKLGLVLKIETRSAFNHLPEILLHAMRSPRVGVMIARGDLAVEAGYERLAELQEEILWLCEAAHLPVIWATEVLDHLARTGQPSRAEVTDAAMAQRAECVMLNKGPHVDTAIVVLDDILRRMAGHQRKKTALLRPLHSWDESL